MAVFKCKMCGGNIEFNEGDSVGICDSCGTKQTLPKASDEAVQSLFNRANTLRLKSEFDRAAELYNKIISVDETQAEAYWGLILCKFGIEYVEDPKTFKRVPTCHRTSFESITADEDYKLALKYGDSAQKMLYEAEAKAIDKIQKDILKIAADEKPFDVFICYKETDDNGRRTQDSVTANEIYHQLTQEGYKVFYAAITLEDKLGQEYEPYIFAALNSAKVMLVIGSKPEYFTAVWVKNEWSRFLKLMKNDRSKLLIPCYKDMDAYELPDDFAHLQAQDMSKIGFINDVVRGIKKVVNKEAEAPAVRETVVMQNENGNVQALLDRGFMALEDGEWAKADAFFEQALNFDAKLAQAYLGKLMVELKVRKREDLKNCAQPFDSNPNYVKACRFDEKLEKELSGYVSFINERNEEKRKADLTRQEEERKSGIYNSAVSKMSSAKYETEYSNAANLFKSIPGYKDADALAEKCLEKAEEEKMLRLQREEKDRLEAERRAEEERIADEKRKAKIKKILKIAFPVIAVFIVFIIILNSVIIPNSNYNKAVELMNNKKYNEAITAFEALDGYKDSEDLILDCKYNKALALMNAGKYDEAIVTFEAIDGYKDSEDLILDCKYNKAVALMNDKNYYEAIAAFEAMDGYKDSAHQIENCRNELSIIFEPIRTKWPFGTISAGGAYTVGLKSDGTVVATKYTGDIEYCFGQCDVSDWKDIVAVSAGGTCTVGLKSDGTVVATKYNGHYYYGQCGVSDWKDIIAVSAGGYHTVGLKSDGTVVATKYTGDYYDGQCDVSDWKDIVAVSAGDDHTVGLKSDGTVVAVGDNDDGQCDVSDWKDIVAVSAGDDHTVGLKSDGTVVATKYTGDKAYYEGQCDVSDWKDIVAVSAGNGFTVGLKSDGTVVATKYNGHHYFGKCGVSDWKDIIAVSAGGEHTVGLKSDGTVVATEYFDSPEFDYDSYCGQCDVSDWKGIKTANK